MKKLFFCVAFLSCFVDSTTSAVICCVTGLESVPRSDNEGGKRVVFFGDFHDETARQAELAAEQADAIHRVWFNNKNRIAIPACENMRADMFVKYKQNYATGILGLARRLDYRVISKEFNPGEYPFDHMPYCKGHGDQALADIDFARNKLPNNWRFALEAIGVDEQLFAEAEQFIIREDEVNSKGVRLNTVFKPGIDFTKWIEASEDPKLIYWHQARCAPDWKYAQFEWAIENGVLIRRKGVGQKYAKKLQSFSTYDLSLLCWIFRKQKLKDWPVVPIYAGASHAERLKKVLIGSGEYRLSFETKCSTREVERLADKRCMFSGEPVSTDEIETALMGPVEKIAKKNSTLCGA